MPAELQAVLVYWPSAAFAGVLVAAVFAAGWFSTSLRRLKANISALAKNRQDLNAARAASKERLVQAKARRAELETLNEAARKLFWQNEKTWIG